MYDNLSNSSVRRYFVHHLFGSDLTMCIRWTLKLIPFWYKSTVFNLHGWHLAPRIWEKHLWKLKKFCGCAQKVGPQNFHSYYLRLKKWICRCALFALGSAALVRHDAFIKWWHHSEWGIIYFSISCCFCVIDQKSLLKTCCMLIYVGQCMFW